MFSKEIYKSFESIQYKKFSFNNIELIMNSLMASYINLDWTTFLLWSKWNNEALRHFKTKSIL